MTVSVLDSLDAVVSRLRRSILGDRVAMPVMVRNVASFGARVVAELKLDGRVGDGAEGLAVLDRAIDGRVEVLGVTVDKLVEKQRSVVSAAVLSRPPKALDSPGSCRAWRHSCATRSRRPSRCVWRSRG